MKKIIILLTLSVQFLSVVAQTPKLAYEHLQFKSNNRVLILEESEQRLAVVLGQPNNVEDFHFEMNQTSGKLFTYSTNKLYTENGLFKYWELNDNTILIGKDDMFVGVGSSESQVFEVFPNYEQYHTSGWISIPLKSENYDLECSYLNFELENGIVKRLWRYDC